MTWIDACLASVKGMQVVVVDNASTDGTVAHIQENYKEVRLLQEPKNLGFGQANNIGIRHALSHKADYVFLLNQDAYLKEDALSNLIAVHRSNMDYGILSPVHFNGDGTTLDRKFSNYMVYDNNPFFYGDILRGDVKAVYQVDFVNAAGWFISTKVLKEVGGFDPVFFMYGEDDNLCHRMKFHGYKIGVVPKAIMRHDRKNVPNTTPKMYTQEYLKARNLYYFSKLGNINKKGIDLIYNKELQKLKKGYWKHILQLKFAKAAWFKKEQNLLSSIYPSILESRKRNQQLNSYFN